jgi:hypothetical protein
MWLGPDTDIEDIVSPVRYTEGGLEVIDILQIKLTDDEFKGYCKGNVLKYLLRYRYKGGARDLEKAQVYLRWLIEVEKGLKISK